MVFMANEQLLWSVAVVRAVYGVAAGGRFHIAVVVAPSPVSGRFHSDVYVYSFGMAHHLYYSSAEVSFPLKQEPLWEM